MSDSDLPDDLEERFQALESKTAYQSYTVDELNSVVIRQQDQIDALLRAVERLKQVIVEGGERTVDAGEEPPPPHY